MATTTTASDYHFAAPFFTLTELQERFNAADRHKLRVATVGKGAPHVAVGREIVFATDSFLRWLHANEQSKPSPESN